MDRDTPQLPSDELEQEGCESENSWSRRQIWKAMAASGGALVASTMLPNRWSKPVVDVGVLPAHAQISQVGYLLACGINQDESFPGYELIDITATVTATGGASVENIPVQYIVESITPSGSTVGPVSGTTDGTGTANLGDFFFCQTFDPEVTQYRLVLSFVDAATYGDATCILGPYYVQGC